jgi:hypothetical protein
VKIFVDSLPLEDKEYAKKDVNYDVIMTLTQGAYRVGDYKEIIRLITS